MTTLFISDLHLDPVRPHIIQQFTRLLETQAQTADALYILGDFLEYWVGDDDPADELDKALRTLNTLNNTPVYLMHGNRDFLIGEAFAKRYNLQLIADPTVIDLYGTPTLLMHGDTLCTDDIKYQEFRKLVRSKEWQNDFLSKPLAERHEIVNNLRDTSKQATSEKDNDIMDVNQTAVLQVMQTHNVTQLIHGHTHRPNIHNFTENNQNMKRIVLGDWYQTAHVLLYDKQNFELTEIDFK